MWHGYFGIENMNLTINQRTQLVVALRQLGPASDLSPANLCHWRVRPDNQAVIFEALFKQEAITVQAFKKFLSNVFENVLSNDINTIIVQQQFATLNTSIVTFSYNASNRLRVAFFGTEINAVTGLVTYFPTWHESRNETRSYLILNKASWETEQ